MSGIVLKHEAPRLCRIRRALFGVSPSAIFSRCTLGLRHGCRACKGCEHNVAELRLEGFEEGAKMISVRAQAKLTEMGLPAQPLKILAVDLAALPDGTSTVEEAEPPEPEKPPDYVEAFRRAVQVYAEAARALHEWLANFAQALAPVAEHFREILREALENVAKLLPKVNKRPDYSQKAKADTKGKIKRIRTQRSREKR
jgi:hypothetical protein